MTANEGLTTDTSMTTEEADSEMSRRVRTAAAGLDEQEETAVKAEDMGIQSSDDEERTKGSEVNIQDAPAQDLEAGEVFTQFNSNPMFKDPKQKDSSQHEFNFGDTDLDKFKEKIQDNLDSHGNKRTSSRGEIDYIGQEADVRLSDNLDNVNLFGVPLDQFGDEGTASSSDKRQFMRELVDVMQAMDPDGVIMDFEKPSTYMQFDPFSPETPEGLEDFDSKFTAIKYEESSKLRASLVLDAYSQQLEKLDASSLSHTDKEKLQRVKKMVKHLSTVKVVDAPVLLKIYNMFRCTL